MYSLNSKSLKIVLQISEIDGAIFDTFQKRGSYSGFPLYRFLRCQPPPSWNRMYNMETPHTQGFPYSPFVPYSLRNFIPILTKSPADLKRKHIV